MFYGILIFAMFVPHEYSDIGPISIDELADVEIPDDHELVYIDTPGHQPNVPYRYDITHFPKLDDRHPGIIIHTAIREIYLQHGTEIDAQIALRGLTQAIHQFTGGVVEIHPFYGAIYNNILDPVAEVFRPGPGDIILGDDRLSTRIAPVPNGGLFSDTLSEHAAGIPLTFVIPSPEADRYLANMKLANQANPNQKSKDQATANDLGNRWQAEFDRYNQADLLNLEPMVVSLGSVSLLMNTLDDSGIFSSPTATVRVRQPAY